MVTHLANANISQAQKLHKARTPCNDFARDDHEVFNARNIKLAKQKHLCSIEDEGSNKESGLVQTAAMASLICMTKV